MRVLDDNVCQHNLFVLGGNKRLLIIVGFIYIYSSFYNVNRITEDLILHDENARYDSPNRWWRYRYFKLCSLPFRVKYNWGGEIIKVRPQVWIRLNRVDK